MCVGLHVSFYWQYDTFLIHSFTINSNIIIPKRKLLAVMPVYRRVCRFFLFIHLIVLIAVYKHDICTFSLLKLVQDSGNLATNIQLHGCFKRTQHNVKIEENLNWSLRMVVSLAFTIFSCWLVLLLFLSGDIHPNPGPATPPSPSSSSSSNISIAPNLSSLCHNLSIVHYNVQSIFPKLEVLHTELIDFDILAFSETWLNDSINTDDLLLHSYNTPERKDRSGDTQGGGVMLYVKEGIHYKRRKDLELRNIERNANDLQTIKTSSVLYYESFLPSSVRAWNSLPSEVRQLESLNSFKHFLNKDKVPVPKYYYTGKRKVQILHTRLRTRCSSLNLDLFIKNVSDSPMCTCGSIEDTQHFFFHCTNFTQQRVELITEVSTYINPSLNILLYGDQTLSFEQNATIFQAVHKYISNTQRFK